MINYRVRISIIFISLQGKGSPILEFKSPIINDICESDQQNTLCTTNSYFKAHNTLANHLLKIKFPNNSNLGTVSFLNTRTQRDFAATKDILIFSHLVTNFIYTDAPYATLDPSLKPCNSTLTTASFKLTK